MASPLEFYFDFASPYSYLAHTRLPSIARRAERAIAYCPVSLGEIKRAAGNIGPAAQDLPAKRRYVQQDTRRWAERYGVPLAEPQGSVAPRLNRGVFFAIARGQACAYIDAVNTQVWAQGKAMDDPSVLNDVAAELGWNADELRQYVVSDTAESLACQATSQARERSVFGVPTVVADRQLWWGNDRLFLVEAYLEKSSMKAQTEERMLAEGMEHDHG
ncbi:MAG: 2-hydroxychromene-2-carboxylate isomerase [Pigmentiphaga sp.]|uniref:2-hydroxychromene-2-carboxylate isomerase n=1 Tax=Pigmentiphaga sp. TaxID=1977564 RepID=UPI003B54A021